MRAAVGTVLVVLALAGSCGAGWAQSPYDYPWCEYYMGSGRGGSSCYFTSYEQCMASARGNGAYCSPNPQYRGGGGGQPYGGRPHHRKRHYYY